MLRRLAAAAAVALCLLLPAAPALASGDAVIKDCVQHGRLTKTYSQKDYRDALAHMPTDVDEYTDCRDIIRQAQLGLGGTGGGGGGNGGGSGGPPAGATGGPSDHAPNPLAGASAQEVAAAKRDIASARHTGAAPRHIGADVVTPGALAYHNLDAVSKLPTPLLVVIVLIAGAALALATYLVLTRVRAGKPGA